MIVRTIEEQKEADKSFKRDVKVFCNELKRKEIMETKAELMELNVIDIVKMIEEREKELQLLKDVYQEKMTD